MYGQGGGGYDPQYNNYNDPYNQQPPSGGPQQQPPPHQQTQQQGGGVNSRSGLYKYILLLRLPFCQTHGCVRPRNVAP